MNLLDKIAKTVVIRDGKYDAAKEHVFTVEGEEFPWYISQRGPVIRRLADDLYAVDVEIMLISKEMRDADGHTDHPYHWYLDFGYATYEGRSTPCIPLINGDEFPWLLTEDGCELKFGHKVFPTLHLAFLAHEVDANIPIEDLRREQDVFCAGGHLVGAAEDGAR